MCGIAVIVKEEGQLVAQAEIKQMTDALVRRGPDSEGFFISNNVALGHRRLAIVDLDTGCQPIYNEDRTIAVVLNGEIYNFKQLREELVNQGHQFYTHTDTEVIVHGYEEWGIQGVLDRIDGMFALALHDSKATTTYIARDKFGEKPLYYYQSNGTCYCASELKALYSVGFPREISKEGLNLFLSLSYIPAPYTIYENVKKLEAGHFLVCKNNQTTNTTYYQLEDHIHPSQQTFEQAVAQLQAMLSESVRSRMVADVPLGAFLSGGIDSSVVVGLMSKHTTEPINTFSIGFREKDYDESDRARLIADTFKTNHTVHYLDYNDVLHLLDDIVSYFDEPYGDSSAIPSYYVAKLAREKVAVVLTGDCADELFGGYEKYLGEYYAKKYNRVPKLIRWLFEAGLTMIPHTSKTNSFLRKAKKVIRSASLSGFDAGYQYMCNGFDDEEREGLLQKSYFMDIKPLVKKNFDRYESKDNLNRLLFNDIQTVLEGDMFPKVDRACMMNSLEARPPFLSAQMVEFAMSLPSSYKVNGNNKKYIVKEAFRSLLPAKTFEFSKSGFRVPISYWFKHELRDELASLLDPDFLEKQGLFNANKVGKLLEEHLSGREEHSSRLWNMFVFQKWYIENYSDIRLFN